MNKRILKIFAVVLSAAMLLSTQILSASAAIRPIYRGDVDDNGKVNIDDATLLQKYLSGSEELSKSGLCAAEVDGDEELTIDDVTMIQKYCAGQIKSFNTEAVWRDIQFYNFYSDYSSGKAPAGTPITFYAQVGGYGNLIYKYYVNDVLISEGTDLNTFTYTFDEAGYYSIYVIVYNEFDIYTEYDEAFKVVDEYSLEQPIINALYFDRLHLMSGSDLTLTANAIGGTAPYEFKFSIDDGLYVQDFSEDNTFNLEPYMSNEYIDFVNKKHTIVVTVKDAAGQIATENVEFWSYV